jgi:hypothetical protein
MDPSTFSDAPALITGAGSMIALLIAAILVIVLPRKYLLVPVLLGVFLIPQGNIIVVAGVHLNPIRVLSLVCILRLIGNKIVFHTELLGGGWNTIDTLFTCWAIARSVAVVLLMQNQAAVINEAGHLWSYFGMYFVVRSLIQNDEDIKRVIIVFVWIAAVNAAGMLYEHFRLRNPFDILLGGVQSAPSNRNGSIRSQGSFQHAILAGSYGVALLPLLFWLWESAKSKAVVIVGVLASFVMIATSASSTPVLGVTGALLAIVFWPLRKSMRLVRWGLTLGIISLHLVMKAPVWFLIGRIDVTGSSTGYFRAMLIDQAVRHFWDWWLIGTMTNGGWGEDMWDLSDQYVAEAFSGGLLTLILFILIIARCYKRIGIARKAIEGDRGQEWLMWLLGVALFGHLMVFFGVSYWDQMWVAWASLLAIIIAATASRMSVPVKAATESSVGLHAMRAAKRTPMLENTYSNADRMKF